MIYWILTIVVILVLAGLAELVWKIAGGIVRLVFGLIKTILPFMLIVVICDFIIEIFEY
jgi:hypothetical protein